VSWLDEFWGDLLSEDPLRITAAWVTLDAESQQRVLEHLQKMATEDGWQPSQQESASAALAVLNEESEADDDS
jgi:hypothetical protein